MIQYVEAGIHILQLEQDPECPDLRDDSTTVNTLNYLDTDPWEKVTDGQKFRGNWVNATNYNIGEVVQFW